MAIGSTVALSFFKCFDAVGSVIGRESSLQKNHLTYPLRFAFGRSGKKENQRGNRLICGRLENEVCRDAESVFVVYD